MLNGFLIRAVLAGALWSFLNILLLTRLAALLGAAERPKRARRLALLLAAATVALAQVRPVKVSHV